MRKIDGLIVSAIIGIMSIVCIQTNNPKQELSDLTVKNIEALTKTNELPELIVVCSSGHSGRCFAPGTRLAMKGEYMYYPCVYVGNPNLYCTNPL